MTDQFNEIRRALTYIPADDRKTWLDVGMAVKSELGDTGYSIWLDWSQYSDKFNERDANAVWKSFKGRGITIKTLFKTALDYGYQSDKAVILPEIKIKPAPKENPNLSDYALKLWSMAQDDDELLASHPYCQRKQIHHAFGARRGQATGAIIGKQSDCIIIPIRSGGTGSVQAVQCINHEGSKQTFGTMTGAYLLLGNEMDASGWYVVEGWATAHAAQVKRNIVTAVAFGLSRLQSTAEMLANQFNPETVIIVKDAE